MSSRKQVEANTTNSGRSTGPKSDQGKARSRLNSFKHGLTAQTVLIAGENPADFEQLLQDLQKDLAPTSSIEVELVARVAGYFWRLRRIPVFEAALLETRRTEIAGSAATINDDPNRHDWLETFAPRKKSPQSDKLQVAPPQTIKAPEPVREYTRVDMGRALIRDGRENDTLGKLSRYEARLLNAVDRTLRQLLVIQNTRMAGEEPRQIAAAPLVVSKK